MASSEPSTVKPRLAPQLADYVLGAKPTDLPAAVRTESVRAFVNWVGCALGGAPTPTVDSAVAALHRFSVGKSRILGRTEQFDPIGAARINCLSSAVHAFDDTHLQTITHPTGPIAAALLGAVETRTIGGEEFLHALICGMEIECRLSAAITAPGSGASPGWYITGITGGIGAAAAVGRVVGLNHAQLVCAIGLAAVQALGNRGSHASMASAYIPALAARNGLEAALMALTGFTCGPAALDGYNGLLDVIAPNADRDRVCLGLGETFEVLNNAYKPYPCGIVIHPVIDACLDIVRTHNPHPDIIDKIEFDVHPAALGLTWRKFPRDELEAQVSLFHWAAAALVSGQAGIEQGEQAFIAHPTVRSLQDKMTASEDSMLAKDQARARLKLKSGETIRADVVHATGSLAKPMSDDELDRKFLALAARSLGEARGKELLAVCRDVGRLQDVSRTLAMGAKR